MTIHKVTLVAEGINVTAETQEEALRHLRSDAFEFRRDWEYQLGGIEDVDAETGIVDRDGDDVRLEVEVDLPEGRGERIWTGRAIFDVIVEAADHAAAEAEAIELMRARP